jgi:hypothetical protein
VRGRISSCRRGAKPRSTGPGGETTRQLCDLGLHLLYQRHFHGGGSVAAHSQGPLFPQLRPEDIANHASSVIRGQGEADALSGQRWTDTWSHQSNYVEDLIAYLFRPGPYVVRIRDTKLALSEMVARGVNLGELVSRDSGCVTPTRPPRRFARRACAR